MPESPAGWLQEAEIQSKAEPRLAQPSTQNSANRNQPWLAPSPRSRAGTAPVVTPAQQQRPGAKRTPELRKASPKPDDCTLSWTNLRLHVPELRAHLIHHEVVVALVLIAILQGGRKAQRLGQEQERLD